MPSTKPVTRGRQVNVKMVVDEEIGRAAAGENNQGRIAAAAAEHGMDLGTEGGQSSRGVSAFI
jgi:hypothetical protein